jgi:branched-subunit amino acid transport protein
MMEGGWGLGATVAVMGVVTYAIRLIPILLTGLGEPPLQLRRALQLIAPAVLSAIVLPELVLRGGELALRVDNGRLLAGAVATVVAWRTKNVLATIAVGMVCLWLLTAWQG